MKPKSGIKSSLKLLAALAVGVTSLAQAQTYQYNVFVKGFKPSAPTVGVGDGSVVVDPNAGNSGGAPEVPALQLSNSRLLFEGDSTSTSTPTQTGLAKVSRVGVDTTASAPLTATQKVTLTNVGTAVAVIGGFSQVNNFSIDTNCPLELPVGQSCDLSVTAKAATTSMEMLNIDVVGAKGVSLVLQTQVPTPPAPILAFDQKVLDFGTITVTSPATLMAKLTNSGDAAGSVAGMTLSAPFSQTNDCGSTLSAGAYCTVSVTLSSTIQASVNSTLAVPQPGSKAITLGLSAKVTPPPTPRLILDQDLIMLGDASPDHAMTGMATLTNSGGASAQLLPVSTGNGFDVSSTCGATLDAGASCTITGNFTGTNFGSYNLPVVLANIDGDVTILRYTASLKDGSGTPHPILKFSPPSLDFGMVGAGQVSNLSAQLSNTGDADSTLASISVSPQKGEYVQTNNCPQVLSAGASCDINVALTASAKSTISGTLSVVDTNHVQGQMDLTATGGYAKLQTPASIDFGTMAAGGFNTRPVVLNNSGTVVVSGLSLDSVSGPYQVVSTTCSTSLNPKDSCTVIVKFSAAGSGAQTGALKISSNGGSNNVALAGASAVTKLSVSATDLTFANTIVGGHDTRSLTLNNAGPDDETITGIGMYLGKTDFAQSNNCGSVLKGGATCNIAVQFTPTQPDFLQGGLGITGAYSDPLAVNLAGSGFYRKLVAGPASVSFGSLNVGVASALKTVTVSNPSSTEASISSIGITPVSTEFTETATTCGTSIAPNGLCTITLQATPASVGDRSGQLSIVSSFGTYNVGLGVTGLKPQGSLTTGGGGTGTGTGTGSTNGTVVFDDTAIGNTSPVRTATFANSGTGPLSIVGISVTSGVGVFGQSNNCGSSIPVGGSCTITMAFTPAGDGTSKGTLTIITAEGQYSLSLQGTAATASGNWSGSADFGSIGVGVKSQRNFSFLNTGSGPMAVSTSLTGSSDVTVVLNNCGSASAPVTLKKGSSCAVILSYSPSVFPSALANTTLTATAPGMAKPATVTLIGSATGYSLAFAAPTAGDFGTVKTGGTITKSVFVNNTSKLSDTLVGGPTVSGDYWSITSTTCSDGKVMAAGSNCQITLALNIPTPAPGSYTAPGSVTVTSKNGASATLPLTAAYSAVAMPLAWEPQYPQFAPLVPGGSSSMYIYLRNKTAFSIKLPAAATFTSNDPAFKGTNYCNAGATLSPNGTCFVSVQIQVPAQPPAGEYLYTGTVSTISTDGSTVSYDMSASYTQTPYTAAWDKNGDYGNIKPGSTYKTLYFRNTSNNKLTIAASPVLSGDSVFKFYDTTGCTANTNLLPLSGGSNTYCTKAVQAIIPAGQPPGTYNYSASVTVGIKEDGFQDTVPLTATLVQEPYTMSLSADGNMGSVAVNGTATKNFTLTNTSQSLEYVASFSFSNPSFYLYNNSCGALNTPNSTCTFAVRVKGIAGTTQTGDMVITNRQGGTFTLPLTVTTP